MNTKNKVLQGDCREMLKTLADESVHMVCTSPPYWGLRNYGSEIGLESDFNAYVTTMVEVFREVRRVLRQDGTLWLNLGDSYAGQPIGSFNGGGFKDKSARTGGRDLSGVATSGTLNKLTGSGLKPKDLCGIPWRVAFALQTDGWWLRQDIIWSKPNPMPESVTDRCTKTHEYVFLLSQSERYYYDAEAMPNQTPRSWCRSLKRERNDRVGGANGHLVRHSPGAMMGASATRNKRSVWEVATKSYPEAHFATYPSDLIQPMILAGSPEKCCAKCGAPWLRGVGKNCRCQAGTAPATVLDPFAGSGTTGFVANRLGRNSVLVELNPDYCRMINNRLQFGIFVSGRPRNTNADFFRIQT